jgi:hypothetical protein
MKLLLVNVGSSGTRFCRTIGGLIDGGCHLGDVTKRVPLNLPNGSKVLVEVTPIGNAREADVAAIQEVVGEYAWEELSCAIEGIAEWIVGTLQKVQPTKASVEFGIEVGAEPGKLTALLVKGSGKANLKITLEWETPKGDARKGSGSN